MKVLNSNAWVLVTLLFSGYSYAESWSKIVVCENGAVNVDVNRDDRQNLQVVLKGNDLLSRLYSAGMISLQYGQQEYIARGQHAALKQVSSTATQPTSLGGVFYSQDFRSLISEDWNNNTMIFELHGTELVFKHLNYSSGTSCDYYEDATGLCRDTNGGTFHKTYTFQGEYILHGCSRL